MRPRVWILQACICTIYEIGLSDGEFLKQVKQCMRTDGSHTGAGQLSVCFLLQVCLVSASGEPRHLQALGTGPYVPVPGWGCPAQGLYKG